MDNRYDLLKEANARNIKEYNEKFVKRRLNPQKGHQYLPFIVLVVDEFADLIMTAGKEVEMPIARSRTAGPGRGDPPDHRHAASVGQYHHRYDQGQFPCPYRLQGVVARSTHGRSLMPAVPIS